MRDFYTIDSAGVLTGQLLLDDLAPRPRGTTTPPPVLAEGQYAVWNGIVWSVVDEYPSPPKTVPQEVSMAQARAALITVGMLEQVEATIAAMGGLEGQIAQNDWEYRTTVRRDWPLVQNLVPALGMTDQQIDDLFRLAATL